MNRLALQDATSGKYFTQPVFLDEKYILLSPETPLTDELRNRLVKWGYSSLLCEGNPVDESPTAPITDAAEDAPLIDLEQGVKERELLKEAQSTYAQMLNFTEKTFTNFVTKNELSQRTVSERIKELVEMVKSHRKYLLRFSALRNLDKNYIVEHSVRTTILSTAIGATLRIPAHKLIELGTAAILHEIGMIRLPPQVYMSSKELSPQERKAILAHTVLGFKILKQYSFPLSVCLAVLECRENLDGTGYPRGLTGERISQYAKIIAVAGSYVAQTADRPFRPAGDPHQAILELIQGRGTKYDEHVLRALISNLSIFPLGTYVELTNGYRGMVVESNNDDPRAPIVRLIASAEGHRYTDQPSVRTTEEQYKIVRTLTPEESQELLDPRS